ncbi:rare lipoprotein A [Anseongella ginsenosidimutans]|uniref:Probable endolytic peptidoglycan transglycosylase RlpA n=1 Tax=Anseongella ginsenosidimutans TaxID=496056 RepID=A0A4R3KRY4_9SPHI|nr:septal ring lytic transglycosylase RlpA family protein [Anseongella ginsenosidimutans]QEC53174.1 septal ring lytic transglycosylase RlpA family protein [Anseongella ginsenosidimutans]TCS87802.1 rare lipoprotein A [Anseongella ginsenosidimutans]
MKPCLIVCFLVLSFLSANAQLEKERGVASYYGKRFDGKRTASGEIFDKEKMTAAHRTLPFGTIVKVTREDNGSFVYVRINDRGPFSRNRLIDLSRKAAEKLGIIQRGHEHVLMEVMREEIFPEELTGMQAYREIRNRLALLTIQQVEMPGIPAIILPALERKPAIKSLPVNDLPETFFKKLLQEVFPES